MSLSAGFPAGSDTLSSPLSEFVPHDTACDPPRSQELLVDRFRSLSFLFLAVTFSFLSIPIHTVFSLCCIDSLSISYLYDPIISLCDIAAVSLA